MPKRLTIEFVRKLIEAKGGKCLTDTYQNNRAKIECQCACGHVWNTTVHSIRKDKWCPKCGDRKLSLEEAQGIAESHGGRCLATEYGASHISLPWVCAIGHTWNTSLANVKCGGTWCPTCAHKKRAEERQGYKVDDLQTFAASKRGNCLSEKYLGIIAHHQWQCAAGHKWSATWGNIFFLGSWCPYCKRKNEQECRKIFETLTGRQFPKVRPKWLEGLELDGYCEELGLAFEYNGEQHYRVVPSWHKNGESDLVAQQDRDAKKADLCINNWVGLFIIPYTLTGAARLEFIRSQLEPIGF